MVGGNRKKCPECRNKLKKGVIEAKDAGSLNQSLTMLTWYPEEYKGKLGKKNTINLGWKEDGC
ncbi:MAG: PF20097 family protein [Suilimivivens sp.]